MTQPAITGQWRVLCEKVRGGKKKSNRIETVYVRADTMEKAEKIGRAVTGLRYAYAYVYEFWNDWAFANYKAEVIE